MLKKLGNEKLPEFKIFYSADTPLDQLYGTDNSLAADMLHTPIPFFILQHYPEWLSQDCDKIIDSRIRDENNHYNPEGYSLEIVTKLLYKAIITGVYGENVLSDICKVYRENIEYLKESLSSDSGRAIDLVEKENADRFLPESDADLASEMRANPFLAMWSLRHQAALGRWTFLRNLPALPELKMRAEEYFKTATSRPANKQPILLNPRCLAKAYEILFEYIKALRACIKSDKYNRTYADHYFPDYDLFLSTLNTTHKKLWRISKGKPAMSNSTMAQKYLSRCTGLLRARLLDLVKNGRIEANAS